MRTVQTRISKRRGDGRSSDPVNDDSTDRDLAAGAAAPRLAPDADHGAHLSGRQSGLAERRHGVLRTNNPGNIEYSPNALRGGAIGYYIVGKYKFAIFHDEQSG